MLEVDQLDNGMRLSNNSITSIANSTNFAMKTNIFARFLKKITLISDSTINPSSNSRFLTYFIVSTTTLYVVSIIK